MLTRIPATIFAIAVLFVCLATSTEVGAQTLTVWPSPIAVTPDDDGNWATSLVVANTGVTSAVGVEVRVTLAEADLVSALPQAVFEDTEAVWALGTLAPGEFRSVELTTTGALAPATVTAVAGDTRAFTAARGTEAAPADEELAAALLPTAGIASDDPFVLAEVALLAGDIVAIDARIAELIYHPYLGALRGARGTLWENAGNALDRAILETAMLRAAGVPARLGEATLADAVAAALLDAIDVESNRLAAPRYTPESLLEMIESVPEAAELLVDAGFPEARAQWPEYVAGLFTRASENPRFMDAARMYWFSERNTGGWVATHPLTGTAIAADSVHVEVPEEEFHTISLSLQVEVFNPGFMLSFGADEYLAAELRSADLAGRPVTLAYESVFSGGAGLVFSSTSRNYTPQLWIDGQVVVEGDTFLELATSFPFGSQFVMGATLEMEIRSPGVSVDSITIPIADRFGAAARSGLVGDTALDINVSEAVAGLAAFDNITIGVGTGAPAHYAELRATSELAASRAALEQVFPALEEMRFRTEDGLVQSADDRALVTQSEQISRDASRAMTSYLANRYLRWASISVEQIAAENIVVAFDSTPRVAVAGVVSTAAGAAPFMDVARNEVTILRPEGVPEFVEQRFKLTRGASDSILEGWVLSTWSTDETTVLIDVTTVFAAAEEQGVPLLELGPNDVFRVASLRLPADAQAAITQTLLDGFGVVTPIAEVDVGGITTVMWYRIDPTTGDMISMDATGRHVAAMQYGTLTNSILGEGFGFAVGALHGWSSGTLKGIAGFLGGTLGKFSAGGAATSAGACALGAGGGTAGGIAGAVIGGGGDPAATAQNLIMTLLGEAASRNKLGVAPFISGFNNGFCLGEMMATAYVQSMTAGAGGADPPIGELGVGQQGPWRRPLWSESMPLTVIEDGFATPDSDHGVWAAGSLVFTNTGVALQGEIRVRGEANVVRDGELLDSGDVDLEVFAVRASTLHGTGVGEVAQRESSIDVRALSGDATGLVEVYAVWEEEAAPTWLRLEAAEVSIDAPRAWGRVTFGDEASADAEIEVTGTFFSNFGLRARMVIDLFAGSTEFPDIEGGVLLEGLPTEVTVSPGEPFSLTPLARGAIEVSRAVAEAPVGWLVDATETSLVVTPTTAVPGDYDVWVLLLDEDLQPIAGSNVRVTIEASAAEVRVSGEYVPLYTAPWGNTQLATIAAFEVSLLGRDAADITLEATANAGFDVVSGADALSLETGGPALVYVRALPETTLPAPGSTVELTITATGPGFVGSDTVSFAMPSVVDADMRLSPDYARGIIGDSGEAVLTLTGTGNATKDITLTLTPPAGVSWDGVPESVSLSPGEELDIPLTWTIEDNALVGFSSGQMLALYDGEVWLNYYPLRVYVASPASAKAFSSADFSQDLDEDLLLRFLELGEAIERVEADCYDNSVLELEVRLNNLATQLGTLVPALLTDELRAQAASLADSGYSCEAVDLDWICATLTQIEDVLRELDDALGPRVFVTSLAAPASVANGDIVNVVATMQNQGDDVSEAFDVTFSARQRGAAAAFATVTIPALAPGETFDAMAGWDSSAVLGSVVLSVATPRDDRFVVVSVEPALAPDGNAPPTFTSVPPVEMLLGEDLEYEVVAEDPDGDAIFYSALLTAPGFRLRDGLVIGRATRPTSLEFSLAATDRYGATTLQDFTIEVATIIDNASPRVTSVPARNTPVDQAWQYTARAIDVDGDALTWSYNDGPAGAAYDAETRTLTWTPTELGVEWFSLSVADERGATTLHRFSVTVTASATRPDFALGDVDLGDVMIDGLTRNGDVTISVTNASGIAAPATELVVFSGSATGTELGRVTVDALAGFASASIDVAIAGEADFARQPLLAVVDLDDEVDEENEANNESRTVVLPNTSDFLYAFMRPVEARVFLVAANNATPFRAIDPASGAILQEGIVEAREALEVTAALVDQDTIVPLNHAMVEADGALQVYLTFEVFNDDFGGDIVHPAIDGSLTGVEYTVFVPTVTSNNRLVVTALDDATVTMRDATLTELESIGLRAGQVWEPQGLTSRQVVTLSSTGRLFVQSASVTGLSSIPPLSSTSTDDVGQRFTFSTRSRGSGGGAFAVIGYEDASFTLRANGQVFAQGEVAQGEVAFFAGIGELRGAVLEATGDVAVLAGDVASPGADRVGLMGEDIVQTLGRGGRSFIVPTLEQLAIEPVVLVGEQTTWLTIDGETQAVAPWSRVTLPQAEVATIEASAPVVVQTMGGGERFFDYASLVRRLAVPFTPADPVLAAASISLETCASSVTATARIGNAGGAPLSADLEVELVALDDDGARIVATERLGVAVASGEFVEVSLSAAGASLESQTSWAIRIAGAQPRAQLLTTDAAVCINEAPSFVTFPPGAVESNTQLTYTALAIDPEGATVRYDLLGGPLGATLNPLSGSLRWDAGEPAVVSFAIAASDDAGEVAVQSFDVLVGSLEECTPENDGDNDGVCPPQDCDDTNENVSPLLTEIVGDGLDNDCNPATPDVVPTGGVGVTVAADSAAYAPGLPVAVTVDVTNRSNTLPINGLSVELEVACVDGSGTTLTNELGQLIASATETSGFEWTETAGVYGVCTLAARVLAGAQLAGSAATTVTFDTSLTGELTIESPEVLLGDSLTVNWSVETSSDSQVSERVTIRRTDVLDPIVSNDVVVTPGMPSAAEEVIDTTGWPTATHRLSLSAANMLLADAEVAVRTENAARAFAAPNAAVDGLEFADGEVIRFRPRGPRASGAGFGGVVQAAWAEDALALRITLNDETADDADRIAFSLTLPDNTSVAAEWTRGAGGEGFSEENGVRGLEVTWTADVETALAFGDVLELAITLEDGPADARNDVWTWGVSPFAGVDGVLTLLEPGAQPEPDVMEDTSTPDAVTDAGADSGQDTGGADSTSDSFENDGTDGTGAETETVEVKGGCGCESAPGAGDGVAWLAVLLGLLGLRFRGRLRVRGVALGLGVLSLGLLTACGGGKDRQVIDIEIDGTGPDAGTGGGNVEVGLPDTGTQDGGLDTGDPDVTPDVVIDVIGPDVTPDAGAWPDLPEPGEGGETGEACEGDNDCASGICQSAGDFALCTELCSAGTCPEGFACQPYPGGVELCVANDVCLDDDGDGYGTAARAWGSTATTPMRWRGPAQQSSVTASTTTVMATWTKAC